MLFSGIFVSSVFSKVIQPNEPLMTLGKKLHYLYDANNQLTVKDLLQSEHNFKVNQSDVFSAMANGGTHWYTFSFSNQSLEDLWMDIGNSNLTQVLLYKIDTTNTIVDSMATSCLSPTYHSLKESYSVKFKLASQNDSQPYRYLLSVQTNLPVELPIYIGSLMDINSNRLWFDYISILYIGCALIMAIYNLFLYFITRKRLYFIYTSYVTTAIFIATYLSNYPIVTSTLGPTISHNYLNVWFWLPFVTTSWFIDEYFDLKKHPIKWLRKGLIAFSISFIGFGVLNLFLPIHETANLYQLTVILFYTFCLFTGYYMLYQRNSRAKLFCIGWTGLMLSALLYPLVYNGILPFNVFTKNMIYFGALFELLIFSLALGHIINELMNEQGKLNKILTKKNMELKELNTSLDSFNYHVSHDLKTVLSNSLALSNMMEKYNEKTNHEKVGEIVTKQKRVIQNGYETVQSFLDMAFSNANINKEKAHPIHLKQEINNVLTNNDLVEKLTVEYGTSQIQQVNMHPKAVESIFLNLFTNTIKYSNEQPKAYIELLASEAHYTIYYSDNGIGLDTEKMGKTIFEPFKRVSSNKNVEGTGIGLFLVKRIVTSYGGTIEVVNKANSGLTFEMNFPRDDWYNS